MSHQPFETESESALVEAELILQPRPEVVFDSSRLAVISGRSNPLLAKEVGKLLGVRIDEPVTLFADRETRVRISHQLDRRDVFVIQPTSPPQVNDYIIELALIIDAAKRASAAAITAIVPYFGYARQDRKEQPRVPISARLMSDLFKAAGADRIITVDIHSAQLQGFFDGPWDNLSASYALTPELKKRDLPGVVVVSPDKGGVVRATEYARLLGSEDIAVVFKQRDIKVRDKSTTLLMIGDVEGRDVLIVDDILSTCGTVTTAAYLLHKNGARKITVAAAHGLFTEDALKKISDSPISEVLVTDSIAHREEVLDNPKIEVVSIAPLLAETILRVHRGQPLHDLFQQ